MELISYWNKTMPQTAVYIELGVLTRPALN